MSQISSKLRSWTNPGNGDQGVSFFCPGCNSSHTIKTQGSGSWGWNGNAERPTFTPSVLVSWDAHPDAADEFKEWRTERRCHSFVTDGLIQFLGDSTHTLAGQTVELADWPEHWE